jgi:diguanylate cyclase (GGDEF)-like protein
MQRGDRGALDLLAAVSADLGDRGTLFGDAASQGRDQTAAWKAFKAQSLGLPGEADLIKQVDLGFPVSNAAGERVAIGTLSGKVSPTDLSDWHKAADAGQSTLAALAQRYDAARGDLAPEIHRLLARQHLDNLLLLGALVGEVALFTATGLRVARRMARDERMVAASAWGNEFEARLHRGFQMATNEGACMEVAKRGLDQVVGDRGEVELLIADASHSRFHPAFGASEGCGVETPADCPVMQHGTPLLSGSTDDLDSCILLASSSAAPCSARCFPLSIGGRSAGVLRVITKSQSSVGKDRTQALAMLSGRLGDRLTMLRAFAKSELQASRDPLTGLANRRSLETQLDRLDLEKYAVVFVDLDRFKQLNDVHGHDMGDRALRTFASVLRSAVRPTDLTCRWGGEEFVIVLPACDGPTAVTIMERVRADLAVALQMGGRPEFTASFGVRAARSGELFEDAVLDADRALRQAKSEGRDRICVAEEPKGGGVSPDVSGVLALVKPQ